MPCKIGRDFSSFPAEGTVLKAHPLARLSRELSSTFGRLTQQACHYFIPCPLGFSPLGSFLQALVKTSGRTVQASNPRDKAATQCQDRCPSLCCPILWSQGPAAGRQLPALYFPLHLGYLFIPQHVSGACLCTHIEPGLGDKDRTDRVLGLVQLFAQSQCEVTAVRVAAEKEGRASGIGIGPTLDNQEKLSRGD